MNFYDLSDQFLENMELPVLISNQSEMPPSDENVNTEVFNHFDTIKDRIIRN